MLDFSHLKGNFHKHWSHLHDLISDPFHKCSYLELQMLAWCGNQRHMVLSWGWASYSGRESQTWLLNLTAPVPFLPFSPSLFLFFSTLLSSPHLSAVLSSFPLLYCSLLSSLFSSFYTTFLFLFLFFSSVRLNVHLKWSLVNDFFLN